MKKAHFAIGLVVFGIGIFVGGCGGDGDVASEAASDTNATSYGSGNPLTAPVDYIGAVGQAKKSAEKTTSVLQMNQNIRLFMGAEGRMPKDLQELVTQGYMPSIPPAPRGFQYRYDPRQGAVTLVKVAQ